MSKKHKHHRTLHDETVTRTRAHGPTGTVTTTPPEDTAWMHRVAVPLGQVKLESVDPPLMLQCLMGDGQPQVSGGYGGWQTVDRPRRAQLTEWNGHASFQVVIPFMLDGFITGVNIQPAIDTLEAMARVNHPSTEPPILILDGGGAIPHDIIHKHDKRWVITDIQWGDAEWHPQNGYKIRQAGSVTLLEYTKDAHLRTTPAKKAKGKKGKGAKHKTYIVKKGDTLPKIAQHELHDPARWKEIAKLNKLRDPNHLKKGQRLKLP